MGIEIDQVEPVEVLTRLDTVIRTRTQAVVAYVNIHAMNIASTEGWFRDFLNTADLCLLDGEGVRLGARIMGYQLLPPIALTRFFWTVCDHCQRRSHHLFLLGSTSRTLNQATQSIKRRFPTLNISGTHHGFFSKKGPESMEIIHLINTANPDVLVVGFGMPTQEEWVRKNRASLHVPAIILGGACLEFAAGTLKEAPSWARRMKLEWMVRLVQEPRRLWKRYLLGIPLFFGRIIYHRIRGEKLTTHVEIAPK